ncbi:hypothetical protein FLA105534_05007 [Flavobacterium bizetiae]|nr:hypothetical protein FLA105534_05007 [Flavobacterium bizetiae]
MASGFENDLETTTVFTLNNNVLLYHTWYARTYDINYNNAKRINDVIKKGVFLKEFDQRKIIYLKSYSFLFRKKIKKSYNKFYNFFFNN